MSIVISANYLNINHENYISFRVNSWLRELLCGRYCPNDVRVPFAFRAKRIHIYDVSETNEMALDKLRARNTKVFAGIAAECHRRHFFNYRTKSMIKLLNCNNSNEIFPIISSAIARLRKELIAANTLLSHDYMIQGSDTIAFCGLRKAADTDIIFQNGAIPEYLEKGLDSKISAYNAPEEIPMHAGIKKENLFDSDDHVWYIYGLRILLPELYLRFKIEYRFMPKNYLDLIMYSERIRGFKIPQFDPERQIGSEECGFKYYSKEKFYSILLDKARRLYKSAIQNSGQIDEIISRHENDPDLIPQSILDKIKEKSLKEYRRISFSVRDS